MWIPTTPSAPHSGKSAYAHAGYFRCGFSEEAAMTVTEGPALGGAGGPDAAAGDERLTMAPYTIQAKTAEPGQAVRGRDAELAALAEHLGQLRSGVGTVALIEGGAGMGKSRVLGEVAAMARRLSIRVGIGEANLGDSVVPLSALMEALLDGSSPILGRAGLRDAHTSLNHRYWLLQDLEALLKRAALEVPVLVCVDDLQWADSWTAAALRALPARLATAPGSGGLRCR